MSYSRWGQSVWYTYADVNGGFTICDEGRWSAKEVRDNWPAIAADLAGRGYSSEQLEELRGYKNRYLASTFAKEELSEEDTADES